MPKTSFLTITLSYNISFKKSETLEGHLGFEKAKELQNELEKILLDGMKEKKIISINLPSTNNDIRHIIDCSKISKFSINRSTN